MVLINFFEDRFKIIECYFTHMGLLEIFLVTAFESIIFFELFKPLEVILYDVLFLLKE